MNRRLIIAGLVSLAAFSAPIAASATTAKPAHEVVKQKTAKKVTMTTSTAATTEAMPTKAKKVQKAK